MTAVRLIALEKKEGLPLRVKLLGELGRHLTAHPDWAENAAGRDRSSMNSLSAQQQDMVPTSRLPTN